MVLRFRMIALGVAAAVAVGMAASTQVSAQDMPSKIDDKAKAATVAKERSNFMEHLSKNEKVLVSVMKGQAPLDAQAVSTAENQAKSANAKEILSHFNPGTGDDVVNDSRARASIWKEWDKFKELASAVGPATAAASVAAKSGDQKAFAEKQMAAVNACAACHKVYRAPRQR
jgi:cytochrome c556